MPSTIGWLDYSEDQKRRMLEVIDLFRERDSVDELGVGLIRDVFANLLFPGLSTSGDLLGGLLSARIGAMEDWCDTGLYDHCPVIVDVDIPS